MRRLLWSAAIMFVVAITATPVAAKGECDFVLFDFSTEPPTEVGTLTYRLGDEVGHLGYKLTGFAPDSELTIDLMKNGETYRSDRFSADAEGQVIVAQRTNEADIGKVTARDR